MIAPVDRLEIKIRAENEKGDAPASPCPEFSSRRLETVRGERRGGSRHSRRLFGRLLGHYRYILSRLFLFEDYGSIGGGEERMVGAHADVGAGVKFGAALADDDIAADYALAAEFLHAEAAAVGVAPIARRAARFLVSHLFIS
jgi:hypothetical protein